MRLCAESPVLAAAIVAADVLSAASSNGRTITFVADSSCPFEALPTDVTPLFWSCSRVIRALERSGYALVSLDKKQLVLVDGCILIPIGGDVSPIVGGKVRVYAPPRPGVLSPELAAVRVLPADVDYRGVYYSLAALFDCAPSIGIKLKHALARCLDDDPDERSLAVV